MLFHILSDFDTDTELTQCTDMGLGLTDSLSQAPFFFGSSEDLLRQICQKLMALTFY